VLGYILTFALSNTNKEKIMSTNNGNSPAMPAKVSVNRDSGDLQPCQFGNDDFSTLGLTKREYFSGMAMQGLMALEDRRTDGIIREAVSIADALLAELAKA
jgi:hypothetical protein